MQIRGFLLTGSPADQAQLEVGDEIVEVNGQNLEDYTHAEVIDLIHEVGIPGRAVEHIQRCPNSHDELGHGLVPSGNLILLLLLLLASPSRVASADFPSPFVRNFCILLRHVSHCHVLSHRIRKSNLRHSPSPLSWQFHPLHPSPICPPTFLRTCVSFLQYIHAMPTVNSVGQVLVPSCNAGCTFCWTSTRSFLQCRLYILLDKYLFLLTM